jgi:hypothetical protein
MTKTSPQDNDIRPNRTRVALSRLFSPPNYSSAVPISFASGNYRKSGEILWPSGIFMSFGGPGSDRSCSYHTPVFTSTITEEHFNLTATNTC